MDRVTKLESTYLHYLGMVEGSSLLLMLFIAMPLRAITHDPTIVRTLGTVHGLLFLMYSYTLVTFAFDRGWPWFKIFTGLFCAVIPFGPFYFHKKIVNR